MTNSHFWRRPRPAASTSPLRRRAAWPGAAAGLLVAACSSGGGEGAGPAPVAEAQVAPTTACATPFEPDDVAITPDQWSINGHEFDYVNDRIALLAEPGARIVVGTLDGATGALTAAGLTVVDASGKATATCPGLAIGNGPEWAISTRYGSELYYNYVTPSGAIGIARAAQAGGTEGPWSVLAPVPGSEGRGCALPSYNPSDEVPLLAYVREGPPTVAAWRLGEPEATENVVPELEFTAATGASPARQVPGRREITFATRDGAGRRQIARKALVTGETEFVSAYAADVDIKSVSVVPAPKHGPNAYDFYANVADQRRDVFLSRDRGDNVASGSLRPPVGASSLRLPIGSG
jgi:hypothetical protein